MENNLEALQRRCDAQLAIIKYLINGLQRIPGIGQKEAVKLDKMGIDSFIKHIKQSFVTQTEKVHQLQCELDNLKHEGERGGGQNLSMFCQYYDIYFSVVSKIIHDDAFFQIRKQTRNQTQNYIIEYNLFNRYLSTFTDDEGAKKLLEKWTELELFSVSGKGSIAYTYTVENKSVRAYRLKKGVVDVVRQCMLA